MMKAQPRRWAVNMRMKKALKMPMRGMKFCGIGGRERSSLLCPVCFVFFLYAQ